MSKRRKAARPRRRVRRRIKVFISHATDDRRRAQYLGRLLKQSGIDYFFSREHLDHGHNWYRGIGDGLESCNWLVIIATPAAVRNGWVRNEVTYALVERRYNNRVVPLLFEDCQLPRLAWSLRAIQYLDFRHGWHPSVDTLLAKLGARRARKTAKKKR